MKKRKEIDIFLWMLALIPLSIITIFLYFNKIEEKKEIEKDYNNKMQCIRSGGDEYIYYNNTCFKTIQKEIKQEIDYKIILELDK